jgi:hypothetical protein
MKYWATLSMKNGEMYYFKRSGDLTTRIKKVDFDKLSGAGVSMTWHPVRGIRTPTFYVKPEGKARVEITPDQFRDSFKDICCASFNPWIAQCKARLMGCGWDDTDLPQSMNMFKTNMATKEFKKIPYLVGKDKVPNDKHFMVHSSFLATTGSLSKYQAKGIPMMCEKDGSCAYSLFLDYTPLFNKVLSEKNSLKMLLGFIAEMHIDGLAVGNLNRDNFVVTDEDEVCLLCGKCVKKGNAAEMAMEYSTVLAQYNKAID